VPAFPISAGSTGAFFQCRNKTFGDLPKILKESRSAMGRERSEDIFLMRSVRARRVQSSKYALYGIFN
jgi:hypothetical protein